MKKSNKVIVRVKRRNYIDKDIAKLLKKSKMKTGFNPISKETKEKEAEATKVLNATRREEQKARNQKRDTTLREKAIEYAKKLKEKYYDILLAADEKKKAKEARHKERLARLEKRKHVPMDKDAREARRKKRAKMRKDLEKTYTPNLTIPGVRKQLEAAKEAA